MPRPRKQSKDTSSLLKAIEFVSLIHKDDKQHCVLKDGWCAASDGVMSLGCKIDGGIDACPQTTRLVAALRKASGGVSLALVDSTRLTVVSGPLRASVPCLPDPPLLLWADPMLASLDSRFIDGCKRIGHIASESGDKVMHHSLLIKGETMLATNSEVLVEFWHGNEMPPYFVLPKPAVTVLLKIAKPIVGFGFTGNSITFYFEDESWFKTQLYEDKWPNVEAVFERCQFEVLEDIPEKLFASLKLISDLIVDEKVKFEVNRLVTGHKTHSEASVEVEGLIGTATFKFNNLIVLDGLVNKYSFNDVTGFMGPHVRGAVVNYRD